MGKSTIAIGLEKKLFQKGYSQILDGDNIRNGINTNLGFSRGRPRKTFVELQKYQNYIYNLASLP